MGVYFKGMKMPQNCDECELNSTCIYSLHMPLYHTDKRGDECPIFEVQEPHGRLIDADDMIKRCKMFEEHPNPYISQRNKDMAYYLDKEDVIIPASGEKEE